MNNVHEAKMFIYTCNLILVIYKWMVNEISTYTTIKFKD